MICPKCGKSLPDVARFCAGCGFSLQSAMQVAETGPKTRKRNRSGKWIVLMLAVVAMMLLVWKTGAFDRLLAAFNDERPAAEAGSASGRSTRGEPSTARASAGSAVSGEMSETPSSNGAAPAGVASESTAGDEALVLDCAMNVQLVDGYLYFIHGTSLVRVDDALTGLEKVITLPDFGKVGIEGILMQLKSFAVLDDMLYYGVTPLDHESDTGYFRIPLSGGKAEFLFLMPQSYLTAKDGCIYLLPVDSGNLAIYDPKQGGLPRILPVTDMPVSMEAMLPPFAISQGSLYYLGVKAGGNRYLTSNLYRTDLTAGTTEVLADHRTNGMDRLIGGLVAGSEFFSLHDLLDTCLIVRHTNLKTGVTEVLQGYEGQTGILGHSGDTLVYPLTQYGVYALAPIRDPARFTETFMGPEAEESEIADMIRKDLQEAVRRKNGTTGADEPADQKADSESKDLLAAHEEIERVCGDFLLTFNEAANFSTGKRLTLTEQDGMIPVVTGQYDDAMAKAAKVWGAWKDKDTSQGVGPE